MADGTIRIDKWLWHARFFKTRTLAQGFVTGGNVRVNKERVEKANHSVKPGDVLTFVRGHVRIVEIVALAERRGPAKEAQALYNDLSPPAPKKNDPDAPAPVAARERGAGRPTKRERRETDRLRGE
ncbi:MAG: RNA-binding S4 domain-containing protein [Rhodospirillales bacterium]|nr:RNA-binding S4 domain-containing protein [Rhodospirillales bacterium]MBO6788101.1 RNA-binding S4 domain-containing protein [Rhodospirillales bacterium]